MSEHPRYQGDRSASHDQRDRTDREQRHRDSRDHNHYASQDDRARNRLNADPDAPRYPETRPAEARYPNNRAGDNRAGEIRAGESRYGDRHHSNGERVDPTFNSPHAEHRERTYSHHQHNAASHNQAGNYAPPEQDVWLREKQNRITYNDFDLQDIQFTPKSEQFKKVAAYFGVAAMIGMVAFLGMSSLPDLTPQEIIATEGYAGEQTTKTPFNLASMRNCEPGTECANAIKSSVTPTIASTTASTTTSTAAGDAEPAIAVTTTITQPSETFDSQFETTTISSTDTFFETTDEVSISNSSSDNFQILEIPAADQFPTTTNEGSFYESLTVLQQWSNVRGTPGVRGDILASLAIGKTVTRIGGTGQWIEVRVDEKPAVTGFMHRSTVGPR